MRVVDLEITKLANPSTLPPSAGTGVSFTGDGNYLAVSTMNSPYITIYKKNGDTFTKLSNPSTLPPANTKGVAFSKDGTYLATTGGNSPYMSIYKRSGDTFTKLTNPSLSFASTGGQDCTLSPDGNYLAFGSGGATTSLIICKRDGDTFTKLDNPSTIPSGIVYGVDFSPDGNYLALAHSNSPYLSIYKRNGDTFTKLSSPSSYPAGGGKGVSFSPDGNYVTIAHSTSPYITTYKRNGDTFTKLSNPDVLPTGVANGVSFSSDSNYLAVAHDTSPYTTVYKKIDDNFIKLANPDTLPRGDSNGVSFSPNGNYLAVAEGSSPNVDIYKYNYLYNNKFLIQTDDEVLVTEKSTETPLTGGASGTARASSVYSSSYGASSAFDKVNTSYWSSSRGTSPEWLEYEFSEPLVVNKYSILPHSKGYSPTSWTFEGSNDGTNWTVLDTRVAVSDLAVDRKDFDFNNKEKFKSYRINMAGQLSAGYIRMYEFEMYYVKPPKLVYLPSASEENIMKLGIEKSTELDFSIAYINKEIIEQSSVPLGDGVVFKRPISKSTIKKLSIK